MTPERHGLTCEKVPHDPARAYLHRADDDGPYWMDNVQYCGRCHAYLPSPWDRAVPLHPPTPAHRGRILVPRR